MLEVKLTCPLGHTCETAVDGVLERCRWYVKLEGENPQNGERVDKFDCAIAWQPLLAVNLGKETSGVGASVQSLRNETSKRMDAALALELRKGDGQEVIASS